MRIYYVFEALGVDEAELRRDVSVCTEPVSAYIDEFTRDGKYDAGRVRYFLDQLKNGVALPPIEIDNACDGPYIYPDPIVADGHHRLIACYLHGQRRVRAHYSGRMDLLSYLKGHKRVRPCEAIFVGV